MLYNRILCLFQNAANLGPASDFYKKLALDCSAQQVAVDLFLLNGQFADIATVCKSAELMRLNQCGWIREMTVSWHWVYVCVRHHTHHWISVSGLGKWVSLHVSLCVCQAPCTPLNHCEWIREMTVSLHASLCVYQAHCWISLSGLGKWQFQYMWIYACIKYYACQAHYCLNKSNCHVFRRFVSLKKKSPFLFLFKFFIFVLFWLELRCLLHIGWRVGRWGD